MARLVPEQTHRMPTVLTVPAYEDTVPSAGGSFKDRSLDWLGLFRNQIMVMALYFSVVGILLSVLLSGFNPTMFLAGGRGSSAPVRVPGHQVLEDHE